MKGAGRRSGKGMDGRECYCKSKMIQSPPNIKIYET